jgi:hypothetical protein
MQFYVGVSTPVLVGFFGEAINIWDNVISTKWVDPATGELLDQRTLTIGDFSPTTFTVNYDGNGNTGGHAPVDSASYAKGQKVTVLANGNPLGILTLTGFDLAGWTMSTGVAGPSYAANGLATFVMGSSNVILHAVWVPDSLSTASLGSVISITGYSSAPTDTLIVPTGVTSIGANAFANCIGMTGLTLPQTLSYIGLGAFSGCTLLVNVTIPSSVGIIDQDAFSGCSGLTTVTMSATTPPSLGPQAFDNTAPGFHILVPSSSFTAYQEAAGWSDYAEAIVSQ